MLLHSQLDVARQADHRRARERAAASTAPAAAAAAGDGFRGTPAGRRRTSPSVRRGRASTGIRTLARRRPRPPPRLPSRPRHAAARPHHHRRKRHAPDTRPTTEDPMTDARGSQARWGAAVLLAPTAAAVFTGATAWTLHHAAAAATASAATTARCSRRRFHRRQASPSCAARSNSTRPGCAAAEVSGGAAHASSVARTGRRGAAPARGAPAGDRHGRRRAGPDGCDDRPASRPRAQPAQGYTPPAAAVAPATTRDSGAGSATAPRGGAGAGSAADPTRPRAPRRSRSDRARPRKRWHSRASSVAWRST